MFVLQVPSQTGVCTSRGLKCLQSPTVRARAKNLDPAYATRRNDDDVTDGQEGGRQRRDGRTDGQRTDDDDATDDGTDGQRMTTTTTRHDGTRWDTTGHDGTDGERTFIYSFK